MHILGDLDMCHFKVMPRRWLVGASVCLWQRNGSYREIWCSNVGAHAELTNVPIEYGTLRPVSLSAVDDCHSIRSLGQPGLDVWQLILAKPPSCGR